jgi:hypothetical protein
MIFEVGDVVVPKYNSSTLYLVTSTDVGRWTSGITLKPLKGQGYVTYYSETALKLCWKDEHV